MLDFFSPVQYILSVGRRIPSPAFAVPGPADFFFIRHSAMRTSRKRQVKFFSLMQMERSDVCAA